MANISGTDAADSLVGTTGDDLIEGLGGDDSLAGDVGNDTLRGGDGNDTLSGGPGNDRLEGGAGRDMLFDGDGDDVAEGDAGDDNFTNERGSDILRGGAGRDSFYVRRDPGNRDSVVVAGGDDEDRIQIDLFGSSAFEVDAGDGADLVEFYGLSAHAQVTLGAGADLLSLAFRVFPEWPLGSITVRDFQTGPGGDQLKWLSFLADNLTGWNHALSPFATGHARLLQSGAHSVLQVDLNGGGNGFVTFITFEKTNLSAFTADNLGGYLPDGTIPAGRTIAGTAGDDNLIGAAGDDLIEGFDGLNIVEGRAGNDTLKGGNGQDRLYGEVGNDTLRGGGGSDELNGGYGDDLLHGEEGDDYLVSDRGADLLDGGPGADRFFIQRDSRTTDDVTAAGGSGRDSFQVSTSGNNILRLDAGADDDDLFLTVMGGTVFLTLGGGRDSLTFNNPLISAFGLGRVEIADFTPGAGGDAMSFQNLLSQGVTGWNGSSNPFGTGHLRLVQNGPDVWLQVDADGGGGDGYRTFVVLKNASVAAFTAENLGGFSPDGSAVAGLTLTGTASAETLNGGGGDDVIRGGGGNDMLSGDGGADRLFGEDGNDYLNGDAGDDVLDGGDGDDSLSDYFGSDVLSGGAGNDEIFISRREPQADRVRSEGGDGNDLISILSYGASSHVVDAGAGNDRVNLSAMSGAAMIHLGAGADILALLQFSHVPIGPIVVEDFALGPGGDRLDFNFFLSGLANWTPAVNPFATGHLRLVQSGSDALVYFDQNGGADNLQLLLTLRNQSAGALGLDNLGFLPVGVHGSPGNDIFRMERGGADTAFGGDGNDGFIFGATFTAEDEVDGGSGERDQVSIQGDYSAGLTLGVKSLVSVETLLVLPGFDYKLTAVDANVAAGGRLEVFGTTLRVDDDLTFDGSAEKDGHFVFYGGAGRDTLTGGAGNDGFYFGPGNFSQTDTLFGGPGSNDQLGLDGHYTTTLGGNFDGIETLVLYRGPENDLNKFNLKTNDAAVAAGQRFTIFGTTLGTDLVFDGSAESDGSFRFLGGAGSDTLTGGKGDDLFFGGRGADTMSGGGGNDTFLYNSTAESTAASADKILAFGAGDKIDLFNIDANAATGENEAFAFIGSDAFSGVAGQLRAVQSASGWTIEGDTNGDKVADLVLSVTTENGHIIAAGDFNF